MIYLVTIQRGIVVEAENPLAALRKAIAEEDVDIEQATAVVIEEVTDEE